jgi:hypothetical protein
MMMRVAAYSGAILLLLGWAADAQAAHPKSPEVKEVIDRGVAFLEKMTDQRIGGRCLIALCILKNGGDPQHARVQEALKACEQLANGEFSGGGVGLPPDNYSVGIAVMFLCEADPADPLRYRDLVEKILEKMLKVQQAGGAWSYAGMQTGDTSQTQYAALGLWTANAVGIKVPQDRVERLCGWLLRTQDVGGSWGYQGVDPGNYNRVAQTPLRPSLGVAGLGSLYICADILGITNPPEAKPGGAVPAALRSVEEKPAKKKSDGVSRVIDAGVVRRAMADGDRAVEAKLGKLPDEWGYYYLYGLERCMSFRELAEGNSELEPKWYNDAFEILRAKQQPNGSWRGTEESDIINSCFAVLFLLRSSKKLIEKIKPLGEGILLGGMGLPTDTADLREKDGKIIETPLAGSVDELLAIIEDPENADLQRLASTGGALALDSDVTKRAGQITKLRAIVSAGSYESRLVAVRLLGKVRDFDNVPVLLYALTDPDVRIVQAADKGLRFVSRKFGGVGLPAEPSATDVKAARDAWKAWYLSVRPDAELLD